MKILPYKGIFPTIAKDVFIAPGACVIGDVTIGELCGIWFNTVVRGDVHYIRIGSETNVQDSSVLHVTPGKYPLIIGDRVSIGHRAIVHGSTIGNDCLIGMGAVILDGAQIGDGCLIAAGSLLTSGFVAPPGTVIMGAPAQVRGEVNESQRDLIKRSYTNYLKLSREYVGPEGLTAKGKIKGFLG